MSLCALFVCASAQAIQNGGTNVPCPLTWQATVCAQETWDASQWTEGFTIVAQPGQTTGHLVVLPSTEPNIDISLTATTSAGDLALLGLIDVDTFVTQNPTVDLSPVITACSSSDQTACDAAIAALAASASEDQLKKAAIWWHGCKNANDYQTKTFTGLPPRSGYVIAAKAENNSSVIIGVNLTHHAVPPQTQTTQVCSAAQSGEMPGYGTYVNKLVGHISLAVSPQHGGTVSSTKTTSIYSLPARGTFKVDSIGTVTFSGTVSSTNCPKLPSPQHILMQERP